MREKCNVDITCINQHRSILIVLLDQIFFKVVDNFNFKIKIKDQLRVTTCYLKLINFKKYTNIS